MHTPNILESTQHTSKLRAITLQFHFQHQQATFSLDLKATLPATGITAIFSPSGAGKSSLLHCIAGLLPVQGYLKINNLRVELLVEMADLPCWQRYYY